MPVICQVLCWASSSRVSLKTPCEKNKTKQKTRVYYTIYIFCVSSKVKLPKIYKQLTFPFLFY